MHSLVQPNEWVALKLPSGVVRILQVAPNSTVSIGKYGSFPSNLIIHRPFHVTYEVLDKRPDESFSRLRIVPAAELYEDLLQDNNTSVGDAESVAGPGDGVEYTLVDEDSGEVVVRSDNLAIGASARQMLTQDEIETLKRDGSAAGKDIIAKLLLSHTALEQKTSFSLAKYKILKNKKYMRRVSVLPLDVLQLSQHFLDKDAAKILEVREEMLALVGCWSNAHYAGIRQGETEPGPITLDDNGHGPSYEAQGGRWLVVDDTGGLLVAAMAERMGVLYPECSPDTATGETPEASKPSPTKGVASTDTAMLDVPPVSTAPREDTAATTETIAKESNGVPANPKPILHHRPDLEVPYARTNTLTVIHSNSQPNLFALKHWGFDVASSTLHNPVPFRTNTSDPSASIAQAEPHPLTSHLLPLSWVQLLRPELDPAYTGDASVAEVPDAVLATWKPNKRGQYHRRRRRWARTRHVVDQARAGGFDGLVVATSMDPTDVIRHTLPLLRGGASVAVYSPTVEPLVALADKFSIARRASWLKSRREGDAKAGEKRPAAAAEEEEAVPDDFDGEGEAGGDDRLQDKISPLMLIGPTIQTSRARQWQVLPGRTHPMMSARGGAEGYVFTGWRALPIEGAVESRGKYKKRKVD